MYQVLVNDKADKTYKSFINLYLSDRSNYLKLAINLTCLYQWYKDTGGVTARLTVPSPTRSHMITILSDILFTFSLSMDDYSNGSTDQKGEIK